MEAQQRALNEIMTPGSNPFDALVAQRDPALAAQLAGQNLTDFYQRAQTPEGAMEIALSLGTGGAGGAAKKAGATTEELLGRFPTTTPGRIVNQTKKNQGYSVNLPTGTVPNDGLMMGMYKNTDPRNLVKEGMISQSDVKAQATKNAAQYGKPDVFFGTWFNQPENKTYLDVVKRFDPKDLRKAVKFGEKTGQLAGFNLGSFEEFPVGNWNKFVNSPEYAQRLTELNKAGQDYLSQHPTLNWWDLHGTPLEEIYGKENLTNMAGYLAATSPVSDVPRNARIASEYMRRQLAKEPIIQPNFRMPETSVFETPGNMMPMETGRKQNLIAASEGRIDDLRKEKVRSMGKALLGDPNAIVLDRHWANLSEKPSENIFTGIEKGVFPSGKQYSDLEKIIAAQAQKEGLTPRDFSANVWTGYRDMAQKNKSVFGQKTAGAGIQGESKSIADTYMDQLMTKAQKLGISKEEIIKRIRAGDMSLLSLLAMPIMPNQENK